MGCQHNICPVTTSDPLTPHTIIIGGAIWLVALALWFAYWWFAAGAFYRTPRPYSLAYNRQFSRVRRHVLDRDGRRCQRCRSPRHLHVHHRIPRRAGGSNDPANLVTLCADCHHLVHRH